MKRLREIIENSWHLCIYSLWLYAIFSLLKERRYTAFLRPEFGVILWLALAILFAFILINFYWVHRISLRGGAALRGVALVIPLLYLLNAQGIPLGSYAFQKRDLGVPSLRQGDSASGKESLSPRPGNETSGEKSTDVSILEIYAAPNLYAGHRVRILGMIRSNEKISKDFGSNAALVYRFTVTCCVADATPSMVVVEGQGASDIPNDHWVTAEGVFSVLVNGEQKTPLIKGATILEAPRPERPYMYSSF